MPVTGVGSKWSSGNLIFYPKISGNYVAFGEDDSGIDMKFFGATASSFMLWDESADQLVFDAADIQLGDTDYLKFGDATGGDVNINWTSSVLQISPAVNDTGSINVGNGTADIDFKIFLGAATSYALFDVGNKKLSLNGAATLQVGESTTGVTTAGGTSMIYGYGYHITNALTGTLRGVRGNAVCHVASVAGTVEGVFGRGANGKATTDTDGVNLNVARGGSFLVAGVGAAGGRTLSYAQGIYAQLDIDAANLTISDARGLYINVQSGNASGNTLTSCDLAYLEYESVVGTAPAINSAIKVAGVGGYTAATQLIDASTFKLATTDTDKVTLMKFQRADGTVVYMRYDTSDNALAFATS